MSYSEFKSQNRRQELVGQALSFSTATASGSVAATAVAALPKTFRRTAIGKVRLRCSVIPNAASTALVASFLNGTSTFATVTLTTATAGQWLDGTVTAANSTLAADVAPTITLAGTATASAAANGSWDIYFENQELYS
jgi:hypothetical protein